MKRHRALHVFIVVVAGAVLLVLIGSYLAHQAAKNAAKALAKALVQDSELVVPVKGVWGQVLLEGGPKDQLAELQQGGGLSALLNDSKARLNAEGLLDAYHKDPRKFEHYAEVFDTWLHALTVDDALQHLAGNSPAPPISASMTTLDPQYRIDAWGHPFCIFKGIDQTAIVSAGPDGRGFTNCKEVKLTGAQIDRLPVVPITRQPSGALIMAFRRRANDDLK